MVIYTYQFFIILLLCVLLSYVYLFYVYLLYLCGRNAHAIYRHNKTQIQLQLQWHPIGNLKLVLVGYLHREICKHQVRLDLLFCWLSKPEVGKRLPAGWPHVFENKVFWKHRHAHWFWPVYGYVPITMTELSDCNRDRRPHKPEILTVWPF